MQKKKFKPLSLAGAGYAALEGSPSRTITLLSYGGGQDSKALLLLYIHDAAFRARYAPDLFLVVMSDTGDEHDHTYADLQEVKRLCLVHKIPFFFLQKEQGYHRPSWQTLMEPQLRGPDDKYEATLVQLKTGSCTDQLKLVPIYKFLDEWISTVMGYGYKVAEGRGHGKAAIKRFGKEGGDLRVLIGFAAGESGRAQKALKREAREKASKKDVFWKYISRYFPLIDLGMDRTACQIYIASKGANVPYPSNCKRCPYMSPEELLWLSIHDPAALEEWIRAEANKIARDAGKPKNYGAMASAKLLPQRLEEVTKKYSGVPMRKLLALLDTHKKNHGCGSSAY